MSKFDPVLPLLEIECWILGVEMCSYRVSLIALDGNSPERGTVATEKIFKNDKNYRKLRYGGAILP